MDEPMLWELERLPVPELVEDGLFPEPLPQGRVLVSWQEPLPLEVSRWR